MGFGYFTNDNRPITECKRHVVCKYDVINEGVARPECAEEYTIDIALIEVNDRKFPCQVYVTDAEYVYRKCDNVSVYPNSEEVPFFANSLIDGEYVGVSKKRKQYNSICQIHTE